LRRVTWLLRGSLALNALLGLALARRLRRRVLIKAGQIKAPDHDFAAVARETFAPAEAGSVVLIGDSHVAIGPWLELLTPYRNRGLSGAKIADVRAWIDEVLAADPAHLVLMIGSNDVYFGVPRGESVAAARLLFAHIAEHAKCPVSIVSVPPLPADLRAVRALNAALAELAAEHGFQWVDIVAPLAKLAWTVDGLHLTPTAYQAIGPVIASAVAPTT
jgi:lysophospholipase L1-like esterase